MRLQFNFRLRTLLASYLLLAVTAQWWMPILVEFLTPEDPNERTQEILFESESLREIRKEWERIWFLEQPDHMTPQREHGGVI